MVYRKATDFEKLIFNPVTWLKLWVASSFLVGLLGSLMYNYIILKYSNLTSFPISLPLNFFFYLLTLAGVSNTILKRSGNGGQLFGYFSYFNGIALGFSLFRIMLAVGLSYVAFIMVRYVPSSTTLFRTFILKSCWILSKFLLHLLR